MPDTGCAPGVVLPFAVLWRGLGPFCGTPPFLSFDVEVEPVLLRHLLVVAEHVEGGWMAEEKRKDDAELGKSGIIIKTKADGDKKLYEHVRRARCELGNRMAYWLHHSSYCP